MKTKNNFSKDFYRYYGREYKTKDILKVIFNHELRFLYFFRKHKEVNNKLLKFFYKIFIRQIRLKYRIKISPEIRIGNNVLIAPNSFVNIDIQDNLIIVGNPCKIIYKEKR